MAAGLFAWVLPSIGVALLLFWWSREFNGLENEQKAMTCKLTQAETRIHELASELNLLHLAEERRTARHKEPEILEFVLSDSIAPKDLNAENIPPFPKINVEDRLR